MPREPFRSSDPSVQHIVDLMDRFGPVRARAMFGGHGLYRDGVMFALLSDGGLYLKVDEQSRPVFVGRNLRAFSFTAKGRTVQLSYHEAPAEALEDMGEMADWCQLAWQAALRAKGAKEKGAGGPRSIGSLADLPNLGPRSLQSLAAAGITSLARLHELGAVRAFVLARAHALGRNQAVSLNLLWALEGALTGRRWQDVADADRASLLMALEDVERHR